jgi:glycosyltransferase 2 family protein
MKSSKYGSILRIGISALAIFVLCYSLRGKIGDSLEILKSEVQWAWFFAAVVIYFLAMAVQSLRLKFVFQVQEIYFTYREVLYLNFVGLFFNIFFPSAVGGDVAKAYYAYKNSKKKIESTTSVILDRLMGFVALILMALVGIVVFSRQINNSNIDHLVYLFLGVMLAGILFFGSKRFARRFKFLTHWIPSEKIKRRLSDVYHAIYGYKKHKNILFICILLSFFAQCFFILMHYILSRSLGVEMNPWIFFILVPIIAIVSMAPSIGGLGVREAGVVYLFQSYMSSERALALSLLLDILIYGYSIVSGLIFSLKGGLKQKAIHEMEEYDEIK